MSDADKIRRLKNECETLSRALDISIKEQDRIRAEYSRAQKHTNNARQAWQAAKSRLIQAGG